MKLNTTSRGFAVLLFRDKYGIPCSLQKSSLASEAAVWLGCDDANPRSLVPGQGWVPCQMPPGYIANTRMHLTRGEVAALLPYLQTFVETGEVQQAGAPRAQPALITGKGADK